MGPRLVFFTGLLFFSAQVHGTGDATLDRGTLRGLKSFGVVVDPPDPEFERQGLTREALHAEIEQRLRRARIPTEANAAQFLGLRVRMVRGKKTPYAVCFDLGLYQPVILSRDHNIRTATETWEAESMVLIPPKALRGGTLDAIDELVDRFVSAYRSVNSD